MKGNRTHHILNTLTEICQMLRHIMEECGSTEYSIPVEEFNSMIYPNKLIKLYDTTSNYIKGDSWQRPATIRPVNGTITLRRGRKYFGMGTDGLIHFNEQGLPVNSFRWSQITDIHNTKHI